MDNLFKKNNKKGLMIELISIIIVGIIAILFFVGYQYAHNTLTNDLRNVNVNSNLNFTTAVNNTFGYVDSGLNYLNIIALSILIGFFIGTLIIGFYSREHPIMIMIYFIAVIVIVIFSIQVSISYAVLENNSVLAGTFANYGAVNFLMENLPFIIAIIGIFGIIAMIAGRMMGDNEI